MLAGKDEIFVQGFAVQEPVAVDHTASVQLRDREPEGEYPLAHPRAHTLPEG